MCDVVISNQHGDIQLRVKKTLKLHLKKWLHLFQSVSIMPDDVMVKQVLIG